MKRIQHCIIQKSRDLLLGAFRILLNCIVYEIILSVFLQFVFHFGESLQRFKSHPSFCTCSAISRLNKSDGHTKSVVKFFAEKISQRRKLFYVLRRTNLPCFPKFRIIRRFVFISKHSHLQETNHWIFSSICHFSVILINHSPALYRHFHIRLSGAEPNFAGINIRKNFLAVAVGKAKFICFHRCCGNTELYRKLALRISFCKNCLIIPRSFELYRGIRNSLTFYSHQGFLLKHHIVCIKRRKNHL